MNSQESLDLVGLRSKDSLPSMSTNIGRKRAVRDLEMTEKRSQLFEELVSAVLEELTVDELRSSPDYIFSFPEAEKNARMIWGERWWLHPDMLNWQKTFDNYWHGVNRRNRRRI